MSDQLREQVGQLQDLLSSGEKLLVDTRARCEVDLKELLSTRIDAVVDYSARGVEQLHIRAVQARAADDRATALQARVKRSLARVHEFARSAEDAYQNLYDCVVVAETGQFDDNRASRSWEERASHYRVRLFDVLLPMQALRREVAYLDELGAAVETRVRGLGQARFSFDSVLRGMQLGSSLGEL